MADQLPTRWLGTFVTAGVLIVTAAFGGLNKAPTAGPSTLAVGEAHSSEQGSVAVERLVITDSIEELPWQVSTDVDGRLVVLVITFTNEWNAPLSSANALDFVVEPTSADTDSASATDNNNDSNDDNSDDESVSLDSDDADTVVRTVDATSVLNLPPGVPVRLAMVWSVDAKTAAALAEAGSLTVTIDDRSLESNPIYPNLPPSWLSPKPAAEVELHADDSTSFSLAKLDGPTGPD